MIRSRPYIRYVPNREFLYNLAAPVLLTAILCTLQHIDSRNVFQTDLKLLSRGEEVPQLVPLFDHADYSRQSVPSTPKRKTPATLFAPTVPISLMMG